MSVYDKKASFALRAQDPTRISDPQRRDRVTLYANGLKAKIRQANYALDTIKDLSVINPSSSSSSSSLSTAVFYSSERIHFYSDSFLVFGRSTLEVFAQLLNQILSLGIDERSCDFASVLDNLQRNQPNAPVTTQLSTIKATLHYIELNDYRNCSLHRRQVFLYCEQRMPVYTTLGYSSVSTPVSHPEWYICDNPLDMTPNVQSRRVLYDYCRNLLESITASVETILISLLP